MTAPSPSPAPAGPDRPAEPAELAPVRPGEELDFDALAAYLRERIPDLDGEFAVLQFPNGSANLTYQVRFGSRRLVVRRPPFGEVAPGAHDMRREYRALSRLYRGYPRAPRAFALCDDPAVIGSDFIVMEYRPGVVVWGAVPEPMRGHRDAARRVGFAVVDALADLHRVDPDECGLSDLGRPAGFLERQVAGWSKRWSLVAPPDGGPAVEALGERLAAAIPASGRPAVLHNDFKIDNCQFDPADPDRVVSVFDWDMATLGDPLVDLGTLLNYWPDPGDAELPGELAIPAGLAEMGLPSRAEVVERYAARSGLDVGRVAWYEAYGCWKTAVILQQLYARYVRGETTDERMGTRGDSVAGLTRRGHAVLDRLAS
ncbi:phosphotransferase family protein [Actinomadura vinacea]|uniref:Phosphotransferase family protein n=1 Tax=Actinomadura vinacea TaxID=115336 RepID=A0ABP5XMF3_9ACTN